MRRLLAVALAAGLASLMFLVSASDSVAPVRAATLVNKHVHDDYFHPTQGFVVGPNHSIAQALCMGATPDPTCTATIAEGDSISWIAPAPLAVNPHSVTECTDGTWTTCGAGSSSPNPIEDSGVLFQPGWPYVVAFNDPGTFYYRCEVHPTVMRGAVQVVAGVGGIVDQPGGAGAAEATTSGAESSSLRYMLAAAMAAIVAFGGVGLFARRQFARSTTED
jgi:plastocyanin